MNEPQMASLLVAHGRPGFYFRVIEEGELEAGDEIVHVSAGPERMTVSEVSALLYMPGPPLAPAGRRRSGRCSIRSETARHRREMQGLPRGPVRLRRGRDFALCALCARSERAAR